MRSKLFRTLAVLIVAGVAAGPNTVAPPAASASTHLWVAVSCSSSGWCDATAFGGTGEYVGWEWSGAEEIGDWDGPWSQADASPHCVSGSMLGVVATVRDSSGASAYGYDWVSCP